MSVFDLHAAVLRDFRDFVRSFFSVADDRARVFVDKVLNEEARLWPDYLLQVSPSYERTSTVDALAGDATLDGETARVFRTEKGEPFTLYRHQLEALKQQASDVVTSGTGSGKSLTYFLPIVDALIRQPARAGTEVPAYEARVPMKPRRACPSRVACRTFSTSPMCACSVMARCTTRQMSRRAMSRCAVSS